MNEESRTIKLSRFLWVSVYKRPDDIEAEPIYAMIEDINSKVRVYLQLSEIDKIYKEAHDLGKKYGV